MKNIQQLNQTNTKGYYITAFFVMLLTTTFLALNFIPLLTKYGNSNAETADVSVEIGPVLSLTLTEEEITLNPTPTPEGTFIHDTLSAIVDTNNKTGYTLTMNTEEEETALAQEDGVTKIDSLANEVTVTSENQSNFTMNRWGYALTDTLTDSETSFLKIPALSTPDTIKTSDAPVSDDTTPVTLATRVDTSLPSGTYKNTLVFSATANFIPTVTPPENTSALTQALADADAEFQEALDGTNYYTMQSMTSSICNAVSTPDKTVTDVPEATLIDTRDNELYTVRKLADGNCWMTQNLRIVGSRTLTSSDSDVSSNWTLPAASTSGFNDHYAANVGPVNSSYGNGAYYSWTAATAGTGTSSVTSGDAPSSVCPKGWRLPPYSGNKSYYNLITTAYSYSNSGQLTAQPLQFAYGGYYYDSSFHGGGSYGDYWSSTALSSTSAYNLDFYSSFVTPQNSNHRYDGFSVRCVAR